MQAHHLLVGLLFGAGCWSSPAADVFHLPAGLKSLELVTVREAGNAADTNGFGAVAYPFQIGKYEVTTAQYVEFLNAKAKGDLDGNLWNNDMDKSRSGEGPRCEIRRSGEKGNYRHTVAPEFANRPVTHVSFLDACRFCNWLHNGQGDGDTETGAYTLNGYTGTDGRRVRRNPGAKFFVPTEDEWYKAAYYDSQKSGGSGYWKYPTRTDAKLGRDPALANAANWFTDGYLDPVHYFTEVGTFSRATSAYGTFDQAGNVFEWTEGLNPPFVRVLRGGAFDSDEADLDELAHQGANLVLFVNAPADVDTEEQTTENIARMLAYLDQARKHNIRVLIQTGGFYSAHVRQDTAEIARQRRWVEAVSRHPAVFGYQLYDEPEYGAGFGLAVAAQRKLGEFVEGFGQTRESLRRWDANPDRLISVVFNLVPLSSWTEYLPVIDSFQVDRYPLDKDQAYFGHRGDWGPLMMAWSMAHGAAALRDHPHLKNPSPCMQGVGPHCLDSGQKTVWRNPLYEETRYMAYSSLTVGAWGVFHWIRKMGFPESPAIDENVGRLYRELRTLIPAFEQSYEKPPFTVQHNHEAITRDFLTDSVADLTTLALEDETNYYLIVSNNSGTFSDVTLRLTGLKLTAPQTRLAQAMNESWSSTLAFSEEAGEWTIEPHSMCFGDVNIWVIPKAPPAE